MNTIKLNIILILLSGGVNVLIPSANKFILLSILIISMVIIPIANYLKVSGEIKDGVGKKVKQHYIYLIVICSIIYACLRTEFASTDINLKGSGIELLLYFAAIYATIIYPKKIINEINEKIEIFNFIFNVLAAYCIINIVFWVVGVENANSKYAGSDDYNQMLSYLGFSVGRALFPMSTGVNSYSIIAGLVLSIGSIKFIFEKNIKNLFIYVIPSLFSVIMADSRGALLSVILALLIFYVIQRFRLYGMLMMSLGTVIVFALINNEYLDFLIREGGVTLLTMRELIWILAIIELMEFKYNHILGYGLYGQYKSGISEGYSFMFGNMENPELATLHNSYLQLVFDFGYVGLIGVLLILVHYIREFSSRYLVQKKWQYAASMVSLIFIIIQGFTEVSINIYQPYIIIYFMSLYIIIKE